MRTKPNQIKRISNIKNFGVFKDFRWKDSVVENNGSSSIFQKVNIIYGRNYSGKTTLSRIIRAFETGILPADYNNAKFSLELQSHGSVSQADLNVTSIEPRVFNQDFVRDNLSFIYDVEGAIAPFAVLGHQNVEIQKDIDALTLKLGENDEKQPTGLYSELSSARHCHQSLVNQQSALEEDVNNKLSELATGRETGIKYQSNLYGDQNYNISKLKREITHVQNSSDMQLSSEQKRLFESEATQEAKATVSDLDMPILKIEEIFQKAEDLLQQELISSNKIAELIAKPKLSKWVRDGLELHKNSQGTCRFCDNPLSEARWDMLKAHFDETSEKLDVKIYRAPIHIYGSTYYALMAALFC